MSAPTNRYEAIAQARELASCEGMNVEGIPTPSEMRHALAEIYTMLEPWAREDELQRLNRAVRERAPEISAGLIWNDKHQEWMASAEFGREAPDSPMAGGAAYGVGDTPEEALDQMLKDMRA